MAMKLHELYTKCDEYLKARTQDIYLWLLDRTGVYLATVITIVWLSALASVTIRDGKVDIVLLVIMGLCCLASMSGYMLQENKKFEVMNASAMDFEASTLRHFGNVYFIAVTTIDAMKMMPYDVAFDLLLFSVGFFHTVKVRDRDKKPFFEKKEELVLDGAL